jgi:multicomponent Na+:H+ antiporter subunit F
MATYLIITALVIAVLILLAIIRIAFSSNIPERIVALDTINTLVVVLLVALGAAYRKALYIDIAIVYGLLSFIGTLFIARYLREERNK